jgi:hypothetical protein
VLHFKFGGLSTKGAVVLGVINVFSPFSKAYVL